MECGRRYFSMKTINKIEQHPTALPRRKRVAAYARVSKETDRLLHSFSEQVSYYNELIQKNPEWEFAGVFADSGITGTKTAHRSEFQRLMQECDSGNVDLILCKSISRFARNTVDLLQTIRHLKEIGVEVQFEKESISTFSGDGEFMLSLLASFAQEESNSISENVKWGIRKRFRDGTVGTANKHILGYRYDEQKRQYVVIPEEAATVRWMFQMFLAGLSFQSIADNLNGVGIRTTLGNDFQEASVRMLLYNDPHHDDRHDDGRHREQKLRRLPPVGVQDSVDHHKMGGRPTKIETRYFDGSEGQTENTLHDKIDFFLQKDRR